MLSVTDRRMLSVTEEDILRRHRRAEVRRQGREFRERHLGTIVNFRDAGGWNLPMTRWGKQQLWYMHKQGLIRFEGPPRYRRWFPTAKGMLIHMGRE